MRRYDDKKHFNFECVPDAGVRVRCLVHVLVHPEMVAEESDDEERVERPGR